MGKTSLHGPGVIRHSQKQASGKLPSLHERKSIHFTPVARTTDMTTTPSPAEQREHFHKLLNDFHTAMLVTHAGDGQLRARPMAIAKVEDDNRVWFMTGAESGKTNEIASDTRVHIVCQNDHTSYLSLSGHANLVQDRTKIGELWQESYRAWFPGGKDDPNIELIVVRPENGEFWDNEGFHKIKTLFETAKAYVTGTTPNLEQGEEYGSVRL